MEEGEAVEEFSGTVAAARPSVYTNWALRSKAAAWYFSPGKSPALPEATPTSGKENLPHAHCLENKQKISRRKEIGSCGG